MPAPQLTPQVPGDDASQNTTLTEESAAQIESFLALDVTEIVDALPAMTDEELSALLAAEAAGDNRTDLVESIGVEIELRGQPKQDPPETEAAEESIAQPPAAPAGEPVRVDALPQAKLSKDGWVVPEPLPNAQPQVR